MRPYGHRKALWNLEILKNKKGSLWKSMPRAVSMISFAIFFLNKILLYIFRFF